jgi:hypothetical protein
MRQAIALSIYAASLLLVLQSLSGSCSGRACEPERLRRRAIVDALTGEARP